MPLRTARILESEVEQAGTPLVALKLGGDQKLHFAFAAVMRGEEPYFVGECFAIYTEELKSFAKSRGRSSMQALNDLATDANGSRAALKAMARGPMPKNFRDRAPKERQLVDGDIPSDVAASLEQVPLHLALPASWRSFKGRLCPFTPEGWSTCVAFDAQSDYTDGDAYTRLTFYSHKVKRQSLELWLVDERLGTQGPLALLARLNNASAQQDSLELVGDPTIKSVEELQRRSSSGDEVFNTRAKRP